MQTNIGSAGDKDDDDYASQQTLFNDLGVELLDNAFQGFNACIFACRSWVSLLQAVDADAISRVVPL